VSNQLIDTVPKSKIDDHAKVSFFDPEMGAALERSWERCGVGGSRRPQDRLRIGVRTGRSPAMILEEASTIDNVTRVISSRRVEVYVTIILQCFEDVAGSAIVGRD
jgi:hypothetical protein